MRKVTGSYAAQKSEPGKNRKIVALILAWTLAVTALGGCAMPWGASNLPGADLSALIEAGQIVCLSQAQNTGTEGAELSAAETLPITGFSVELIREAVRQARQEGIDNVVLSPISVYIALLALGFGAEGDSLTELETVLGLEHEQWSEAGQTLMKYMNRVRGNSILSTANSVWVDTQAQIREEYLSRVAESLYSDVFQADLSSQEIVVPINTWADEKTNGMIPNLRSEPYDPLVMTALLNAVYMEGKWSLPFLGKDTVKKVFTAEDGRQVRTEFLCDFCSSRDYVQGDGIEGVMLPYDDGKLAFVALRATDQRKVEDILGDLTAEAWQKLCESAAPVGMNLSMPKFTLEYEQELTPVLHRMGLEKTMTPGAADLRAMGTGPDGIPLDSVGAAQKVKIQVNEEGTRAAAVTEVTVAAQGAFLTKPVELHFETPYVYAIVDRTTGLPLFMGVMDHPLGEPVE